MKNDRTVSAPHAPVASGFILRQHSQSFVSIAILVCAIVTCFGVVVFTPFSFAEEGFHPLRDHLPRALVEIEKSTVAVWNPSNAKAGQIAGATGVLVKIKTDKHGNRTGLFLSNAHVMDKCRNVMTCQYKAFHHYIYNRLNIPISADDLSWNAELKVVGFEADVDLAAFTVALPAKFNGAPVPMRMWAKNDSPRVYALGNPNTAARTEWHVPRPKHDDRRTYWSMGLVGRVLDNSINGHVAKIIFSSTDLLPGNSGGPLVDVNGNVVGINRSIERVPHAAYLASDMYAKSIAIKTVEEFLATVMF